MESKRIFFDKKWCLKLGLTLVLLIVFVCGLFGMPVNASENSDNIHILSIPSSDAILLESNGRFGMIDAGEDSDYPDGTNLKYPARDGIIVEEGFENKVIEYMKSLGVNKNNFEFLIGTHPHSDHIGAADEIIHEFSPNRVYIMEYKDEYISDTNHLWDNLYVYDKMIEAARQEGAIIIQNFDVKAPVIPANGSTLGNPEFTLGDMNIEILNYNDDYKASPKPDANWFSLGVKVSVNGHSAFLSGDINNYDGDEDRLARVIGHVDVLKLGHHGHGGSSTESFLDSLTPDITIQTGLFSNLKEDTLNNFNKLGTRFFSLEPYIDSQNAIIISMSDNEITTNVDGDSYFLSRKDAPYLAFYKDGKLENCNGYIKYGGSEYYFNNSPYPKKDQWIESEKGYHYLLSDGKLAKDMWISSTYYVNKEGVWVQNELKPSKLGWIHEEGKWYYLKSDLNKVRGWYKIDGYWYFFDDDGIMQTGWIKDNNKMYYLDSSGRMLANQWLKYQEKWFYLSKDGSTYQNKWKDGYYLNANGVWEPDKKILPGWYYLENKWYYVCSSGKLATGWMYIDGSWYYLRSSGEMATGWMYIDGSWYYLRSSGKMATGWMYIDGSWYYLRSSGKMATGWMHIDGSWYYLCSSGKMATGWMHIDGSWYYLCSSGKMATGWMHIDGSWYYLRNSGAMARNCWIGNCYVDSSGKWVKKS